MTQVLVTGAAGVIGSGLVSHLSQAGMRVVALDCDAEGLERVSAGAQCAVHVADLGAADGDVIASTLLDQFGLFDCVVNNAATTTPWHQWPNGTFLRTDLQVLRHVLNVNLLTPWMLTATLVSALVDAERSGSVVWVSSLHDHRRGVFPAYSTSKAAVAMLVREAAAELAVHNIRVNAVSPGAVSAGGFASKVVPLGCEGKPEDIAWVVEFLLSDKARHVTGANWVVDGGLDTHSWLDDRNWSEWSAAERAAREAPDRR